MAAQHIVRPALLGAAGDDQHRRLAVGVDLLVDLGVRQQLEFNDVFDVDWRGRRPLRLRESRGPAER